MTDNLLFIGMIKLINVIVKILATVIFFPIGGLLTILSLIFWDAKYIQVANDILGEMIWGK